MTMIDYLALAADVVKKAAAQGVEAEAFVAEDLSTHIKVSKGQVEQLSQSSSHGIGVRIIDQGRTGYAYTSDFAEPALERTWKTAVELAKVATPDEFRSLPALSPIPDAGDLDIWDQDLPGVSAQAKI